ncbi:DUF2953 domain-containing protein [Bacillus sp. FJAT-50079]|uniref:DUF2953 domain-containing protein n=1 Tax=Bacillus sp. FJAT-50079 TaxID=2833577 RepID=UPI001BC9E0A3|nr:DUF2953 domain-containing protein [Bacillus sp. FJAT-50079]MBS4208754.1 DUF2953 domain-containing protein [Bacillus sp. FJAT-50079]
MLFPVIILIVAVALIFLYFLRIHITITLKNTHVKIKISTFFHLIRIKRELDLLNIPERKDISLDQRLDNLKQKYCDVKPMIRQVDRFFLKTRRRVFTWKTMIGLGDAHATAIAAGMIYSLKGIVLTFLKTHMRWKSKPDVDVVQNVHEYTWRMHLQCMISFKAGDAILTAWKLYRLWKKTQKAHTSRVHAADRRSLDG